MNVILVAEIHKKETESVKTLVRSKLVDMIKGTVKLDR